MHLAKRKISLIYPSIHLSIYPSVYYALFRGIGNAIGQAKCTLWQGGARVVRNCVAALGVSRGNPRTLPGFWKKDFAFSWEAGDLPGGMVVYIQIERSGVCKCLRIEWMSLRCCTMD